jgi:hypothetical protein
VQELVETAKQNMADIKAERMDTWMANKDDTLHAKKMNAVQNYWKTETLAAHVHASWRRSHNAAQGLDSRSGTVSRSASRQY